MSTDPEADDELEFGGHPNAESLALAKAIDATWRKTRHSSFGDIVQAYKAVEFEFVVRAGSNEIYVLETRRRVAEALLREAHGSQPFDTCQKLWDDLLCIGFANIEIKCIMTWYYADSCRKNKEPEAGLAELEPLIAELERLLTEPTATEDAAGDYQDELAKLGKLRARLKAQQG